MGMFQTWGPSAFDQRKRDEALEAAAMQRMSDYLDRRSEKATAKPEASFADAAKKLATEKGISYSAAAAIVNKSNPKLFEKGVK